MSINTIASFAIALCLSAGLSQAATIFVTSDTGNASALDGVGAGSVTPLTLSPADGGGVINLTTISAFNGNSPQTMDILGTAFGVGNQRWGNTEQRWTFSFDIDVSFDAIGFRRSNQGIRIESTAWADDSNTSGGSAIDDTDWTFTDQGAFGRFEFFSGPGPDILFDFSTAGVSNVSAGTPITIRHFFGAGGAEMLSFTITPIPEPSSTALLGLGGLAFLLRRRR